MMTGLQASLHFGTEIKIRKKPSIELLSSTDRNVIKEALLRKMNAMQNDSMQLQQLATDVFHPDNNLAANNDRSQKMMELLNRPHILHNASNIRTLIEVGLEFYPEALDKFVSDKTPRVRKI